VGNNSGGEKQSWAGVASTATALAGVLVAAFVPSAGSGAIAARAEPNHVSGGPRAAHRWARPPQRSARLSRQAAFSPDTLLVRFRHGVSGVRRNGVLAAHGLRPARAVGRTGFAVVETRGRSATQLRDALRRDPSVAEVELNHVRRAFVEPNDLLFGKGGQKHYLRLVRMPTAWDAATGSPQTIAIVDTGVDSDHPDLAGRVLPGRDFVNGDLDASDDEGHGTMVAGFAAAAGNNGKGAAGAAWNARILPVKVLNTGGSGSDADIAAGITWAVDQGADIINLSLGGPGESDVLRAAIEYATAQDVVVVAAAGNDGFPEPSYPAAFAGVVAVGATDWSGNVVWWSNYGSWVDLVAPGYEVWSTASAPGAVESYEAGYGTSFSAPLVAGVGALVRAKNPGWSQQRVGDELTGSARDAGPRGRDDFYGHGLLDAAAALGAAKAPPLRAPAGDSLEPNGAIDRATPLTDPFFTSATISPQGDVDWFAKDVTGPGTIRLQIESSWAEPYAEAMFPAAQAFGSRLQPLGKPIRGISTNTWVTIDAPAAGRYYVKVWNDAASRSRLANATPWGYTVKVTVEARQPVRRFEPFEVLPQGGVYSSAVADVTGDGRDDLLATSTGSMKLHLYRQRPDGYLADPESHSMHPTHSWRDLPIATGDANGDGAKDVAVSFASGGSVSGVDVYYGGLSLSTPNLVYEATDMGFPYFGDVDGDGKDDLIVSSASRGLQVLRSTGAGFAAPTTVTTQAVGLLAVGDLNGDGRTDIAACCTYDFNTQNYYFDVHVQGTGGGWTSRTYHFAFLYYPGALAVGEVTGDGRSDLIMSQPANRPNSKIVVFRQDASGALAAPVRYDTHDLATPVAAADVNGDGRADVVTAHDGWWQAGVLLQTAGGALGPTELFPTPDHSYHRESSLGVGDLNGDGQVDISLGDPNSGVVVLRQTSTTWPPPLWVRDASPADNSEGASTGVAPTIRFGRALQSASVSSSTVRLENAETGASVPATVSYDGAARVATVRPTSALSPTTPYRGVVSGVSDSSGATMDEEFSFRFTVGTTPDPTPPETTITSGVWGADAHETGFDFIASEPGVRFEVSVDAGSWNATDTPLVYAWLAEGTRNVRIRAIDAAGNVDATPASRTWTMPPANDNLASAQSLSSASGGITATSVMATREAGEPAHGPAPGGRSIWFRWTAPAGGPVQFDTFGSEFDTVLGVYTGSGISSLTPVAFNDDAAGTQWSRVVFTAVAGTSYAVAVDGGYGIPRGTASLTWGTPTATDLTPPETTIDSGPSGTMSARGGTFTFSSSEPGSLFECSLDGAIFGACSSPKAYSGLTIGSHTFDVRAVDAAGNRDSSPARRAWTVVGQPIVLAAGDIADCIPGDDGEQKTATIIDGYPDATVAALGDLAYPDGTAANFQDCYHPSWGRHKTRTKPALGNHEYDSGSANPYFDYFGTAAGPRAKGWYSYDLGAWHVVVLNSNCTIVDCSPTSEQLEWLQADLAAHPVDCTLAYWHHPLFTSGSHANDTDLPLVRTFWNELYARGADLILVGHDHDYERFAPQTPAGALDLSYGIREFVVGTGGANLRGFGPPRANSEARESGTYGVLKLTLSPGSYGWQFLSEPGKTFTDTGTGNCHGAPDQTPPEGNPTISSSHTPAWSNDNTVQVNWSGASDSGSGVDGFSYSWTQSAGDSPDAIKDVEEDVGSATSSPLADGEWWFHLRTKDNAGNWGGATHLGPFRIDTAAPANPTLSSSHVPEAWSNDTSVDVSWTGASDALSGVDGYSYFWTQSADDAPDTTKEPAGTATSATHADGQWWFHLRTRDAAGNWSEAVHRGPFRIDTSLPWNPVPTSTHPSDWSTDNTIDVNWSGATDTGGGVDGFSYSWTQQHDSSPDMTKDVEETTASAASGQLADGQWWFHLRTRDNAGNWSGATHLGPFRIDRAAPGNPTLAFSHVEDDWSNDNTVVVDWEGASDPLSGVDGFAYSWTVQATADPGTTKTAEENIGSATSLALPDGSWWFHFRTRDNAGNWSAPVHRGPFKIDTTAPTNPTLSSPSHDVGEWSNEATVVVEWDGEPNHEYSFEWSQDQSDVPDDISEGPDQQAAESLADGAWWFLLRTRDADGSWSGTAQYGPFLLDTTAPVTTIVSGPPGSTTDSAAVFQFSASETANLVCGLDGAGLSACASPVSYVALATGDHVFRVRATDRAGNHSALSEWRWTIVAEPPPPPPQPSPPPPAPPPPPPADQPPKRPPSVARCVVPHVIGRTARKARIMIERAGCRMGRVRGVYSVRVRKGFVLSQGPRFGRRLPRGSRVGVVVSLGKKPTPRRR
jgi:serine protease